MGEDEREEREREERECKEGLALCLPDWEAEAKKADERERQKEREKFLESDPLEDGFVASNLIIPSPTSDVCDDTGVVEHWSTKSRLVDTAAVAEIPRPNLTQMNTQLQTQLEVYPPPPKRGMDLEVKRQREEERRKREAEREKERERVAFVEKERTRLFNDAGASAITTPAVWIPFEDRAFGLSNDLLQKLRMSGVRGLFQWQQEILSAQCGRHVPTPLASNLIVSAPTSAGKSLIGKIAVLRCVTMGHHAIVTVPFVSLAAQTTKGYSRIVPEGVPVYNVSGSRKPPPWSKAPCVLVCTPEKGHSVLDAYFLANRGTSIGVVVVDELHQVGEDSERAATLEMFLSRLVSHAEYSTTAHGWLRPDIRILGMSATLSNTQEVAHWLRAGTFETTFRPTNLRIYSVNKNGEVHDSKSVYKGVVKEYINIREALYIAQQKKGGSQRSQSRSKAPALSVAESLCMSDHKTLAFCSSRAKCETFGGTVARLRKQFKPTPPQSVLQARHTLAQEMMAVHGIEDKVLREMVMGGVCYHHAGLLTAQKELVELAFSSGVLDVLSATSTLAAGVNLPARRVVITSPSMGRVSDMLSASSLTQMCGRAGRAGFDPCGDAFICHPGDRHNMASLLDGKESNPLEPISDPLGLSEEITSCLSGSFRHTASSYMVRHPKEKVGEILSVAMRLYGTSRVLVGLRHVCKCTLSYQQDQYALLKSVLAVLLDAGSTLLSKSLHAAMIPKAFCMSPLHLNMECDPAKLVIDVRDAQGGTLTEIAEAASNARVSVYDALHLQHRFSRALSAGILCGSDVHVLALGMPIVRRKDGDRDVSGDGLLRPDMQIVERMLDKGQSGKELMAIFTALGVTDDYMRCKFRHSYITDDAMESGLWLVWNALVMASVLRETPDAVTCNTFRIKFGDLQRLKLSVGKGVATCSRLAEELRHWQLQALFEMMTRRIQEGTLPDILSLLRIRGVGPGRARALRRGGIRTPVDIVSLGDTGIVELLGTTLGVAPLKEAGVILRAAMEIVAQDAREEEAKQ
ncbi:hypothetical protein KIPB_001479 [Kipferlia bialata]|uniref:Uncharacterized protein n=1 Tax=Kipferlia bialata TaxID=797122 RepID=A0A9K3CQR9_9EUKA|nr:hypothetical protein KIPB_001479 [Kipferlia bialata]|eukprot:g1479.t1